MRAHYRRSSVCIINELRAISRGAAELARRSAGLIDGGAAVADCFNVVLFNCYFYNLVGLFMF